MVLAPDRYQLENGSDKKDVLHDEPDCFTNVYKNMGWVNSMQNKKILSLKD